MIFLYIRPQDWVPFFMGWPTAYIVIPLGLAVGYANYSKEKQAFQVPQNKILLFYLLVIFVSTYLAVGLEEANEQFVIFLKRIVVFYMVIWLLCSKDYIYRTIYVLLFLSMFLAYQGILEGVTGEAWGGVRPLQNYEEIRIIWYGDWDGPNVFAILFLISASITLEFIFGKYKLMTRIIASACFLTFIVAIYYTNSRGAVLALVFGIAFYFWDRIKNIGTMVFAVLILVGIFSFGPSRMSEVNSNESSARERTWLWEQGLTMLQENPLLGVGRGQFAKNVDSELIAHNNYVQNFAETGLLGFFFFVSMLWFTFKGNYILIKNTKELDPEIVSLAWMLITALVTYSAATFFVVMELDLLYFTIGLATAVYLVGVREIKEKPRIRYTRQDLLIIGGSMSGIIFMIWVAAVLEVL